MNLYQGQPPINVPHGYDQQAGGGAPAGYPPYPPYQPQPVKAGMNKASWVALAVAALLLVVMGGWYAWGSYQGNQAKKIPVYPGAHLVPSSVFEAGSG